MPIESVYQFREIEFHLEATTASTFTILTELPGYSMQTRHTASIASTTRRPVNIRFPGWVKGALTQLRIVPSNGAVRIYAGRIMGRQLGSAAAWAWLDLPVRPTVEGYASAPLPIRPSAEEFAAAPLPIRPTQEGYASTALPIRPSPEAFSPGALPIRDTPEAFASGPLPIRPTPEAFSLAALPIMGTPPVAQWVELPVDVIE